MRHGIVLAALLLLLLVAGCGGATSTSGGAGAGGGQQASCSGDQVAVPDIVGGDHQAGQDELLAARFVDVKEIDASGKNRPIDLDREWTVTKTEPAAGSCVDPNATITVYAKKDGE
jgi:hypothetical protein